MGKEEKMLSELLEKVSALEDKITNMEFLMVQGMGAGGSTLKSPSGTSAGGAPPVKNTFSFIHATFTSPILQSLLS